MMNSSELSELLKKQKLVSDNDSLASALAEKVTVEEVTKGTVAMEEDSPGDDMLFILSGKFSVLVGGTKLSELATGNHVGEMSVVDSENTRSASIVADVDSSVGRLNREDFSAIANEFPELWKSIAVELASRLRQTNGYLTRWEPPIERPDVEEDPIKE